MALDSRARLLLVAVVSIVAVVADGIASAQPRPLPVVKAEG